jgi:putative phosphoribosyl transferase
VPPFVPFADRRAAGRALAAPLLDRRDPSPVVLGLPRGGVPVAAEVARALGAPLDVIVVRKLGAPNQPELAMGALGEEGVRVLDEALIARLRASPAEVARIERTERAELEARVARFRAVRARVPLAGRSAVVVDDGIATGSTARAACLVARAHGADQVVVATPVAPASSLPGLREVADDVVCLASPSPFHAVGEWYRDFTPTGEDEVLALLRAAARSTSP